MLIELPTADEIDRLAMSTPTFEVRKFEQDMGARKADLNYTPCKGQMVLVIRGPNGIALVRKKGGKGWSLPSGRIAPQEEVAKAAKRVAREECGLILRSFDLAAMYDVVWRYSDLSIKRLHFVYACLTDDMDCLIGQRTDTASARFFSKMPEAVLDDEIGRNAVADCSAK